MHSSAGESAMGSFGGGGGGGAAKPPPKVEPNVGGSVTTG